MGRYRLRTWVRRRAPWWLLDRGLFAKGGEHCGEHQWYVEQNTGSVLHWRCYHCEFGQKITTIGGG